MISVNIHELVSKEGQLVSKQGSHMALCRALFGSSWWFMSWLVVISSDSCHGSWWFNVMVRGGLMSWFVVVRSGSWWFNVMVRGGS